MVKENVSSALCDLERFCLFFFPFKCTFLRDHVQMHGQVTASCEGPCNDWAHHAQTSQWPIRGMGCSNFGPVISFLKKRESDYQPILRIHCTFKATCYAIMLGRCGLRCLDYQSAAFFDYAQKVLHGPFNPLRRYAHNSVRHSFLLFQKEAKKEQGISYFGWIEPLAE